MKKHLYLYVILLVFVSVQSILMKDIGWFPDIALVMVVFAGIYQGVRNGAGMGLAAGFLRGCFSPETLALDIFLFTAIGIISSVLSGKLSQQSFFAQMLTVIGMASAVIAVQVFYLNSVYENDVRIGFVLVASWKYLITTVVIAPFLFAGLRRAGLDAEGTVH